MRYIIFIFFLVYFVPCLAQKADTAHPAQKLLDQEVANKHCIGLSAAYAIDGELVWQGAAGMSDEAASIPYQVITKNRTASITKSMTAVAIMQLMEAGKIDLDKKVIDYLSDFPKTTITVRQVLNHSSGIRAYKNNKERSNKTNYPTLNDALKIFIDDDLMFEPGSDFNYTSYGYNVLGLLIEEISGLTFEAYLGQNIWDKVDMTHTGIEKFGEQVANKANVYHKNDKGKISEPKMTDLSDRIPAGGVYSTAPDLIKFGIGVLDGTLISKETMILMQENLGLKKEGNGYGLGWYLYGENPKLGNVFGHNGAQFGSSCWLMLLPDSNAVVAVLSNTSGALQETFGVTMGIFGLIP